MHAYKGLKFLNVCYETISPLSYASPISFSLTLLADYFNTRELNGMIVLLSILFQYYVYIFPMENEDLTLFPPVNIMHTHTHTPPHMNPSHLPITPSSKYGYIVNLVESLCNFYYCNDVKVFRGELHVLIFLSCTTFCFLWSDKYLGFFHLSVLCAHNWFNAQIPTHCLTLLSRSEDISCIVSTSPFLKKAHLEPSHLLTSGLTGLPMISFHCHSGIYSSPWFFSFAGSPVSWIPHLFP